MNSTSEIERRKEAAIDALRLKAFETNSDADRQAYFDAVSKWFQDRHIRRVNAERVPFLSVQGAVKKLEWGEMRHTEEYSFAQDAETPIGRYIATDTGWFLQGQSGWKSEDNIEAAKAAAQADYEARILSALEPAATCNESLQVEPAAPEGQQPVTEAMELARTVLAQSITAGHNVPGPTPKDIEKAFWALDAAIKSQPSQTGGDRHGE